MRGWPDGGEEMSRVPGAGGGGQLWSRLGVGRVVLGLLLPPWSYVPVSSVCQQVSETLSQCLSHILGSYQSGLKSRVLNSLFSSEEVTTPFGL